MLSPSRYAMPRIDNDDDVGQPMASAVFSDDPPGYNVANADWDDSGAAQRPGLTAKAEAAGFSPVRFHKGRNHTLEVDPRTKLRIQNVPAESRVSFAELQDAVIHVFVPCSKITSGEDYLPRVLIITDQTLFLCTKEGAVSRCFMVDQISLLSVCLDNKLLGITVPTEYDVLIKFHNATDRDRVIKVIRTVYRRLARDRLRVDEMKVKKLEAGFNMKKPPNYRLTLIPQRTKEQLRQALEVFEKEEEALMEELDIIQDEMEQKHQGRMTDLQVQIEDDLAKLKTIVRTVWDNEEILAKRREEVLKGRRLIEEVDGTFSPDGELPVSKDAQVAELELIVARLNAAVYAAGTETGRRDGQGPGPGANYFRKDFESALYDPRWTTGTAGTGAAGELKAVTSGLQEQLATVNDEILISRKIVEEGLDIETKLRNVEERVAYLRNAQRSGRALTATEAARHAQASVGGLTSMPSRSNYGGLNASSAVAQQPGAEVYDQSYAWLSDLPQEISVDTLHVDPRTGLHFVDIPDVIKPYFGDVVNSVLHFFAVVRKPARLGELVKRVVLIGDQALYLATPNGDIKRCIDVVDIDEILLDSSFGIGFHCKQDYDLCFTCITGEHRQEIIDILQRLYKFASGGRAIPVSEVPRHQKMEAFLKLQQPPNYKLAFTPFRSRQELVDEIREKRDVVVYNAPAKGGGSAIVPADVQMPKAEYLRLRANVAKTLDYEWRQDAALVQLRAQIDALEKQRRVSNDEAYELKAKIDQHKCEDGVGLQAGSFPVAPGAGIMPSSGPGVFRPHAEGLFFIKVDPVVVNCELDVLKVAMNRECFFTGHSNGFVSMWDAADNTFIRSFREHTGKITSMHVHGSELLTASTDRTVRRWDLTTQTCRGILGDHNGPVTCLHREGNRVVTGCTDGIIRLWDLERSVAIHPFKGHNSAVRDLKFQENTLVSVEWGWAIFWDLRSNRASKMLRDEFGGINCVDYADGMAVAGGCGGDITVWDVGQQTGDTISAHDDDVLCVQLVGKNAVSSGGDHKIRMWDLASMKSLGIFHECHPYECPSFVMEGKRFVAAQGPFVKIWSK
jgi:hypothetical protein